MPDLTIDNTKTLLDAGASHVGAQLGHGGTPFVVVPIGYKVESLAALCPPQHVVAQPQFTDLDSFCFYVSRFKVAGTVLFCNLHENGCDLRAIIDYHPDSSSPSVCTHHARFSLQITPDWRAFMGKNKAAMTQADFATFLEENANLFTNPSGAELLELVLSLEGKSEARYNSAIKLPTGAVRFSFEQDIELRGNSTVTNGTLEMPTILDVALVPFEGMPLVGLQARLRWRLADRKITFWYEAIRPAQAVRSIALEALSKVYAQTGLKPLMGALA